MADVVTGWYICTMHIHTYVLYTALLNYYLKYFTLPYRAEVHPHTTTTTKVQPARRGGWLVAATLALPSASSTKYTSFGQLGATSEESHTLSAQTRHPRDSDRKVPLLLDQWQTIESQYGATKFGCLDRNETLRRRADIPSCNLFGSFCLRLCVASALKKLRGRPVSAVRGSLYCFSTW